MELNNGSRLLAVFNFFGQRLPPPPPFATFKEGFLHVAKTVRNHEQFLEGMLLKNMEEQGKVQYRHLVPAPVGRTSDCLLVATIMDNMSKK